MDAPRITHCSTWLRLRMRGLRFRELSRAVGSFMGGFGWVLSRVAELKTTDLLPLEVTVVEPIAGEPRVARELERAGFEKLMAFTLPEFTGENASHVYVDREQRTVAEAIWFKSAGGERSTVAFSSLIEEGPVRRLRSVELTRDAPLDPPPGWAVRYDGGELAERAGRHREALLALGHRAVRVDAVTLLDQLHLGHLESTRHGLTRGAYQVAEAELVEELMRSHRLQRAGATERGRVEP